MQQRVSSRTAFGVARLRAVHQLLDGEPKILDDAVAVRLLDADVVGEIRSNPAGPNRPQARALRADVVLRGRYAEERLAQAVQRGVRQYVILGAGFDTFAYRQPDWARALRIYEVDHPATQDDKRQRLRAAGVAMPANLEFVAVDFEAAALRDALRASALDCSAPAFFSCLGVLVYLTPQAASGVFDLVAAFPAGSEIVFTFAAPEAASSGLAERLSAMGEPWLTYLEPERLAADLRARGFAKIAFLSSEEAERKYFQGRSDGLQLGGVENIAAAIVGDRGP
jgi:methyltransferase (TIGR00027 family)